MRIEEYAVIGDTQAAALVGTNGSIDWLCLPRFDSAACFAALLGEDRHGTWALAPRGGPTRVTRRYREGTLVLETEMECAGGTVRLIDLMPPRRREPDLVRVVEGVSGRVEMTTSITPAFDYGSAIPWITSDGSRRWRFIAGPDALYLDTEVPVASHGTGVSGEFSVGAGDRVAMVLAWHPSYELPPEAIDPHRAVADTEAWWREWSARSTYDGDWRDLVQRSLLTLKALTYAPSGGIVAAATTSLPERIGGVRNWDYRYCWVRDATFTLYALLVAGYVDEAVAWRDWLLRAVAGEPAAMQIMYGPAGERRLTELELPWLPGYEGSAPVRVGNAASTQLQLDVYGEVMDVLHQGRRVGAPHDDAAWDLQRALLETLEGRWREPDEGIWEVRGPRRHFTHSKVMAWVAADRAVKAVERHGFDGPVERWRALRATIHDEVCAEGFDADRNTFVQSYGDRRLDGSLLMIPLVGFLPPEDPRVAGTVDAIQRELCEDGFVLRYRTDESSDVDGLPGGEGAFLACTFWLADNLLLIGRRREALAVFDRLRGLCNDVGLLSEEYDPAAGRLVGNYPQALSHVSLINTARNLSRRGGPAEDREREGAR